MLTKILGKGLPCLGALVCLWPIYGQSFHLKVSPASGPMASDGKIELVQNTANQAFKIQWKGPNAFYAQTPDINQLRPGTYCVTVTDENLYQQFSCKYLKYRCADPAFAITTKQPTYGNKDGALSLKLPANSGGQFSFSWNTGDSCQSLDGLQSGYYHLTITNKYSGCTYFPGIHLNEQNFEITNHEHAIEEPPLLKVTEVANLEVRPAKIFGAVRKLAITALYPNPFQNDLFLEMDCPSSSWITILLQDCYNRCVSKDIRYAKEGKNQISLSYPDHLPKGLYIIGITDNAGSTVYQKVIHHPHSTIP